MQLQTKGGSPLDPHWRTVANKYKLKARIGKGSFGEVVRAKERN